MDETPFENENPRELVKRLALAKAQAVAKQFTDALIIGADTIGVLNDQILCKPITEEKTIEQLQMMSGKTVTFFTGTCLLNAKTNQSLIEVDTFDISFRVLSKMVIKNYLEKEQPFHCAGSLKIEGFGITLVEKLSGEDYTALIGLPLIKLTKMFEKIGFPLI